MFSIYGFIYAFVARPVCGELLGETSRINSLGFIVFEPRSGSYFGTQCRQNKLVLVVQQPKCGSFIGTQCRQNKLVLVVQQPKCDTFVGKHKDKIDWLQLAGIRTRYLCWNIT